MQLQEALLPGASSRATAQHFPWAEPSCWQVSCPVGLQAGEGSTCGEGQGLLLSCHSLTIQPTAGPYNLRFEENGRKRQRSSRQIFMVGFCAAGMGLDTLVLPAVVPVPSCCQVCAMCHQLSLVRLSDSRPGLWAAGGVPSGVYFASWDGVSPLERLYRTSEVKLTLLSPPSL